MAEARNRPAITALRLPAVPEVAEREKWGLPPIRSPSWPSKQGTQPQANWLAVPDFSRSSLLPWASSVAAGELACAILKRHQRFSNSEIRMIETTWPSRGFEHSCFEFVSYFVLCFGCGRRPPYGFLTRSYLIDSTDEAWSSGQWHTTPRANWRRTLQRRLRGPRRPLHG